MPLGTGEVIGWILFIIVISVMFFAAFGNSNITETTMEEYIRKLMEREKEGEQ